LRTPPQPTLFPSTTLFRSIEQLVEQQAHQDTDGHHTQQDPQQNERDRGLGSAHHLEHVPDLVIPALLLLLALRGRVGGVLLRHDVLSLPFTRAVSGPPPALSSPLHRRRRPGRRTSKSGGCGASAPTTFGGSGMGES